VTGSVAAGDAAAAGAATAAAAGTGLEAAAAIMLLEGTENAPAARLARLLPPGKSAAQC
jgi:hypothetical protein